MVKKKKRVLERRDDVVSPTDQNGNGNLADITFASIGDHLKINKVDTSKDKIAQPDLAADERMIIPKLGSSVILCGKSGSGKSTLLQNLMTDPRFYGKSEANPKGWFDKVFIFSPTAGTDDVLRSLGIPSKHVFTDIKDAAELLQVIQDSQKNKLEGGGKAHQVEQYAVIFEDIIGETHFMNTEFFKKMFYMVRHLNCTTFISTQHFTRVPKVCRLQAGTIYFFAGSAAEVEIITEEYAPPMYSKKEFTHFVNEVTRGDHDFLTVCMKVGVKWRFRRNLDEFITLSRLGKPDEAPESKRPKKEPASKASTFCEEDVNCDEGLKKSIDLRRGRKDVDEQAQRFFGEWAHKGARNRTLW